MTATRGRPSVQTRRPVVATRKVRDWAKAEGYAVGTHGRLPERLIAEYRASRRRHPTAIGRQP